MKIPFVVLFSLALLQTLSAQKLKTTSATVAFFSEAPLEDIAANSTELKGAISYQDSSIALLMQVNTFAFKKQLMQEHFNENYMESEKFPLAKFSGKLSFLPDLSKDGVYDISTTGNLTIHGVTQIRTIYGKAEVKNGKLSVSSTFDVALKDYKIKIPKMVIKNLAEVVEVTTTMHFE